MTSSPSRTAATPGLGLPSTAPAALAVALAGVVNVLDIPTVVLGGHLAEAADALAPAVEAMLRQRVLSGRWVRPGIVTVAGDPAPGATGAALRELSALLAAPARWLRPAV